MTRPAFLIENVRVFDGVDVAYPSGHVLIEDGKISSITAERPSSIPEGTATIDGRGKTLLPGLIDAHIHAGNDVDVLKQSLRFGVTTVLDMHNEPEIVARMVVAAQADDSSDFKSACLAATVKDGWPAPIFRMFDQSPEVSQA
jgi:N-acyl-D-aspartate/D-glutamate deacylase